MEWEADRKVLVYAMADTHGATIEMSEDDDGRLRGVLQWPTGHRYTAWGTEEKVLDGLAEEMLRVSHARRMASR